MNKILLLLCISSSAFSSQNPLTLQPANTNPLPLMVAKVAHEQGVKRSRAANEPLALTAAAAVEEPQAKKARNNGGGGVEPIKPNTWQRTTIKFAWSKDLDQHKKAAESNPAERARIENGGGAAAAPVDLMILAHAASAAAPIVENNEQSNTEQRGGGGAADIKVSAERSGDVRSTDVYVNESNQCTFPDCKKASYSFPSKDAVRNHIRRVHFKISNYRCKVCNQGFLKKTQLTVHKRIHTGEKPFSCEYCRDKFAYKDSLDRHKKKHFNSASQSASNSGGGGGASASAPMQVDK